MMTHHSLRTNDTPYCEALSATTRHDVLDTVAGGPAAVRTESDAHRDSTPPDAAEAR